MNRADLLHSVLSDGRPHSRQDIFDRVGFMLTNNAASELRGRGVDVGHRVEGGVHIYQLGSLSESPAEPHDPADRVSSGEAGGALSETSRTAPPPSSGSPASPVSLTLFEAAA